MGSKLNRSILQFQQHLFRAFFFSQMTSCVVSLAAVFWMSRNAGGSAAWHPKNARDIMCLSRASCAMHYDVTYHPFPINSPIFEDVGGWKPCILFIRRKPACCRSEPLLTDIFKPQNLSKMCLFFILFSRIIINVIILKQLVASGDVNMDE